MKLNNETIREAVKLWLEDEAAATKKYGFINDWDTSEVTVMSNLFVDANLDAHDFNSPIGNWDVSNVKSMFAMFFQAKSFNQPLDSWDVSKVTSMDLMFYKAKSFNQPLNNWDVGNVTSMESMFKDTESYNQPLDSWDVSNVVSMDSMFYKANSFNQPLNNWDVSNVKLMIGMFSGAESFNQPIGDWDVSKVTNMREMFEAAKSFNQPLNNWDVSSVESMEAMFYNAESFNQSLDKWEINNFTKTEEMFYGSKKINHSLDKSANEGRKYLFDDWDEYFVEEQIEEEPMWYENHHNSETLSMFLTLANIHFSSHPKINELCYQFDNNYNDSLKSYEKCFEVEFEMPKELKKHISLKKYDIELTEAFQEGNDYLTFDVDCNLTFEIKTNYEEATSVIDEFQEKNDDLRWNISVYWNDEK